MEDEKDTVRPASAMPATRGYQQEMLEESLHKNIIIALDTGSGKTHIAVLRLKYEMEREPTKVRIIHLLSVIILKFTLVLSFPGSLRRL